MSLIIDNISDILNNDNITDQQSDAHKQIWAYASSINKEGRNWTPSDIEMMAETHYVNKDVVEHLFKKVFENQKDEFGYNKRNPIEKIEIYLKKKYIFGHNIITGQYQYKLKESNEDWETIHTNTIFRELRHNGFTISKNDLTSIIHSDFCKSYDPFTDYFQYLEKQKKWDEKTDWIGRLADCIETNDNDFWKIMLRKQLVRSIPCALGMGENRYVIVLIDDKQEIGKTRFIKYLNPFNNLYYTELTIFANIKDGECALVENFIYNLEEIEELTPRELSKLKSVISRSIVKIRKPYAENADTFVRRCTFWASTNKHELLSDIKNTRWLCFNVHGIDWKNYSQNISIDDVWAQAYALYIDGFNYQLTPEERIIRDRQNTIYQARGNERDMIEKLFVKPETESIADFMTNAEIEEHLINLTDNKLRFNNYKIGRAMGQLGFKNDMRKRNGHTTRGWFVKKNEAFNTENNNNGAKNFSEPIKEMETLPF